MSREYSILEMPKKKDLIYSEYTLNLLYKIHNFYRIVLISIRKDENKRLITKVKNKSTIHLASVIRVLVSIFIIAYASKGVESRINSFHRINRLIDNQQDESFLRNRIHQEDTA